MTGRGVSLGRIFGVRVSAELSVLVIGGLLAWSFASSLLPSVVPGLVPAAYWSVGVLGAGLFLISLLGHELAHSVVARRNDVGVLGITLWIFGGVAQLERDPDTPGAEFRIAAAGPAASLLIGAAFWLGSLGLDRLGAPETWVVMFAWLGVINGFLAVFNLLPGAPLDGGRILGSGLWKLRGDRATGLAGAAQVGKFIAVGLMAFGVFEMWRLENIGGLWTVLIGFFLFNAARSEAAYYSAERDLAGITVGEAMLGPVQVTSTWATVSHAVTGPFANSTQDAVPVVDAAGQVRGLLTMEQVKRLPADRWGATQVVELMSPVASVELLEPDTSMTDAIGRMGPLGRALVLDGSRLVGMLGPGEIQRSAAMRRHNGRGTFRSTANAGPSNDGTDTVSRP